MIPESQLRLNAMGFAVNTVSLLKAESRNETNAGADTIIAIADQYFEWLKGKPETILKVRDGQGTLSTVKK